MRAVILAADRGAGLDPLTAEIPAALVPVLDRPVMAHTVGLLRRHGIDEVVVVVGHRPEAVRRYFGAGVGFTNDIPRGPALVIDGHVLTDLDVTALLDAHAAAGARETVCVKDGVECGIRVVGTEATGGMQRHEVACYCLALETPQLLRRGAFDLLERRVDLPVAGDEVAAGLTLGEGSSLDGIAMIEPPVWIGADVEIGEHAVLRGPLVVGDEAAIGDGAQLRGSVILPGSTVPRETILVDGVAGMVDSLR
jgi:mannose-1-phosphate guanylyltransferase